MDFLGLLIKAVRGLKVSTPETRSLLYDRTRTAMDKHLGGCEATTIAALRQDLENAILEVEIGALALVSIASAQSTVLESNPDDASPSSKPTMFAPTIISIPLDISPAWLQRIPSRIVFTDVETTGLHSSDRIVSLAAIKLATPRLSLSESHNGMTTLEIVHLIFDPGKKSHPKAEEVHGYDDWTLRYQEPFADYAQLISEFINSGDLVVAHNASFDLRFIDQELKTVGLPPIAIPVYCTMQAFRDFGTGESASLNAVCRNFGLQRAGEKHGALEDAWLAKRLYLKFHHVPWFAKFSAFPDPSPTNFKSPPPRPDGPLPRRKRRARKKAE